MSSNLIRKIFSQINSGLRIMLKKGKTHRDLTLSNILFSYTNNKEDDFIIKIGDFGLTTDLSSKSKSIKQAGTELFRAPEIEKGKYSNKCDLYSIGIILYMLKTGEYIFDGETHYDKLKNKYANKIKKEIDDTKLNSLIKKLVVIDPHKRMEWKDYFNDPFFKVNDEYNEQIPEYKVIEKFRTMKKEKIKKVDGYKIEILGMKKSFKFDLESLEIKGKEKEIYTIESSDINIKGEKKNKEFEEEQMEPLEIKGVEKEPLTFDLESLEINVPGVKINISIEKLDDIKLEETPAKKQSNWNEEISPINDNIFDIDRKPKPENQIISSDGIEIKSKENEPYTIETFVIYYISNGELE